jgi:uncharacterized protein (DUF488 family)
MRAQEIFTIGYEGREIDDFISHLKSLKITRLIDVRELPLSRKRGFSKSQLKRRMESENIEYVHIRSLGSPSKIRHRLREDHNYDQFFSAFHNHLAVNTEAIARAHGYIRDGTNCLMCYERSSDRCHRSAVAQKIKEYDGNGLKIVHI